MIQRFSVNPNQIDKYTEVLLSGGAIDGFPLLTIDTDSYVVEAEIQSGLNFDPAAGRHCIAIGKYCSLADKVTLMIDLNHDYESVTQSVPSFLKDIKIAPKIVKKGSVIIQNDVWIGHGATIMGGCVLHNGCIVATDAVVTKDVPPYAVVGGNPAKIIKYRFDKNIIDSLLKIAWWDWADDLKYKRREDFALPVGEFVNKYLPEAQEKCAGFTKYEKNPDRKSILFIPDVNDKYPLWHKVFKEYLEVNRPDSELIVYLPKAESTEQNIKLIESELQKYDNDCYVILQTGEDLDERALFDYADFFVTTRSRKTVYYTGLCDVYAVKILFGTDAPVFSLF